MGSLNIPESSLVYVDTSVVIYSVEKFPNYSPLLEPLWISLLSNKIQVFSSELILMETLVVPLRNADATLIDAYEQLLLSSEIQLIPISQTILKEAANLRATTNLKTPDPIHSATALSINCTQFITNDQSFRNIPNLPVVVISEVLAS